MRIAFLDTIDHRYTIATAYEQPLGGTASAVCYLAEEIAHRGHAVFLLNRTATAERSRGVICYPIAAVTAELRASLDVLIVVNLAGEGRQLRQTLAEKTRLVLWTGHAADQTAMQGLHDPEEQAAYDGIVLVSEWQRQEYLREFGLDLSQTRVLRNAISPAFCDRPDPIQPRSPILAYTSTPFRGLDVLLEAFPRIRRSRPNVTLKVFSSMSVYRQSESPHTALYRQCQQMEGVSYIGAISQPELAQELHTVSLLAYPNTFAETSCIAVMEAMASGCWIVTSDRGALAETTAGFAHLIPVQSRERYLDQFVAATIARLQIPSAEADAHLRQQVSYATTHYTWTRRADEWLEWLCNGYPGSLNQQAYDFLLAGEYDRAVTEYEMAIAQAPNERSHYWYLGLALLLHGQSEAAQTAWMLALMQHSKSLDRAVEELIHSLQTEQQRQRVLNQPAAIAAIQTCIDQLQTEG